MFDELPYNKVVFTYQKYKDIESAVYVPKMKREILQGGAEDRFTNRKIFVPDLFEKTFEPKSQTYR